MWRKSIILFFLHIACDNLLLSQVERTRNWYFGDGISIFFPEINKQLEVRTDRQGKTFEGTSIWNDRFGNLLYYADWGSIYDSSGVLLNSSFKLGGDGSASQATILTALNDTILHCFGSSAEIFDSHFKLGGFNYSKYNALTKKWLIKGEKLRKASSEAQAHVNHQNGRWQWVVSHSRLGDTLYSYLITDEGLETCPIISHAGPFYSDWYPGQGIIKFSADGKYLVLTPWGLDLFVFCSFNNQTGAITEMFRIDCLGANGVEFSENNLFISCPRDRKIRRFSLKEVEKSKIEKSNTVLFDTSDLFSLGQIQKAPDGNIYVALDGSNRLGRISSNSTDNLFSYTKPLFGSKVCYLGFPNFNASYFHTPAINFNYKRNCKTNTFYFTATDTIQANSWQWQYSKGSISYTGSGKQTDYTFSDTGLWQVRCIGSNGSRKDTVTKTIEILNPLPPSYLGEDILLPKGASTNGIISGPNNMYCIHWQRLGDTVEQNVKNYNYIDTGFYVCKATNAVFCSYSDTIRVRVCDSFANAAIIERSGDSLFTKTYASKYQWYLNNTAINGATNKQLKINQTGNYALRTWNAAGCDSVSALLNVNQLGLKYVDFDKIKVYPNPNSGIFTIQSNSSFIQSIVVFDITGKVVFEKEYLNLYKIELESLVNSGVYLVKVNDLFLHKVIINH